MSVVHVIHRFMVDPASVLRWITILPRVIIIMATVTDTVMGTVMDTVIIIEQVKPRTVRLQLTKWKPSMRTEKELLDDDVMMMELIMPTMRMDRTQMIQSQMTLTNLEMCGLANVAALVDTCQLILFAI